MNNDNIDPRQVFIGNYLKRLKKQSFVIPEYQRAYTWDISSCDKLWEDIDSFRKSGQEEAYFFGTVITDNSTPGEIRLIDGQQRTTTFLLLAKALQLRIQDVLADFSSNEDTERLKKGLETTRDKILEILLKAEDVGEIVDLLNNWELIKNVSLVVNESMNERHGDDLKAILNAKSFVEAEKSVFTDSKKKKDNRYSNFFRNFKFFYIDKVSALEQTELYDFAKNFLTKCQIIEIRSWNFEQAIQMFNSRNSTGQRLADGDIISAKLYENAKESSSETSNALKEKWEGLLALLSNPDIKDIVSIDSVLQQFMYIDRARGKKTDVNISAVRKYYLNEKKGYLCKPIDLCNKFIKIAAIWEKIEDYPLVKVLLKFNENIKLFFASYLSRFNVEEISETKIAIVAESLLKLFAMLELSNAAYSSKYFKMFLFEENVRLVDASVSESDIADDFSRHIAESWKDKNIVLEQLKNYDGNILVYLNEYLYAKERELIFVIDDSVNIEHIMPSSGKNNSSIQEMAGIKDEEEFKSYVNKLGNKILLEEKINKHLQDEWFRQKKTKSIKEKAGYKDSKYGIARALIDYPSDRWTKDDIDKATEKAANRIANFIFS